MRVCVCLIVCKLEISKKVAKPDLGCSATERGKYFSTAWNFQFGTVYCNT